MFGFGKYEKLYAPVTGETVDLSEVPDKVFSDKMMGEGIAIEPEDDVVRAPADGEITVVHECGHALCMKTSSGTDLLIHIGLDTVKLKGQEFIKGVQEGDKVQRGQEIIRFNRKTMQARGYNVITMLIVLETSKENLKIINRGTDVTVGDSIVIEVKRKWKSLRSSITMPYTQRKKAEQSSY